MVDNESYVSVDESYDPVEEPTVNEAPLIQPRPTVLAKNEPVVVKHEPVIVKHEPIVVKYVPAIVKDEPIIVKKEPIAYKTESPMKTVTAIQENSPAGTKRLSKNMLTSSWINDILQQKAEKLGISYKRFRNK